MPASQFCLPIVYFILTAAAGVVLRLMGLLPQWQAYYEPVLHAHSHIALLGWGYTALLLLLAVCLLPADALSSRFFRFNWTATQLTVLAMFTAFTLQGYGLYSIALSTIHILLSYTMGIWMWRRLSGSAKSRIGVRFAKASLFFMMLSSLGPWCLAVLSANGLQESPAYDAAIYFYLHCQYNGWFSLGLFALLYAYLEKHGAGIPGRWAALHYRLYTASLLPSFLLSLLWLKLGPLWVAVAIAAGAAQLISVAAFFAVWAAGWKEVRPFFTGWSRTFLQLALLCLAFKMTLELGSAVPALEPLVFSTRSVVIGYLHLVLLGFVSCMLMAIMLQHKWMQMKGLIGNAGGVLFIIGLVGNEALLFADGLLHWMKAGGLPGVREALLLASVLLLTGISLIGWGSGRFASSLIPAHLPDSGAGTLYSGASLHK